MPSQYRLIRLIASGGMAQVFEAAITGELGFERRVAVKRILPQYAHSAELRRMFLDEAHIASRLHHTNIVSVLDYGVVDGDEFLVMEYVDGVDLGRVVDAGREAGRPMPEGIALHVIAEVAHALDYAHRCQDGDGRPLGIVHRDVSPGNILLSWEGQVKLSDFGIAFAAVREARTETGMVKGKQAYMAPEQAMRQPVTAATDIYSLGVTLAVTAASKYIDPRALDDRGELSAGVAEIVAACIRREPAARIATAELAARLSRAALDRLGREPGDALRAWLSEIRPRLERRRPLDAMLELVLAPVADDGSREFTAHPAASAGTELVAAETVVERPRRRSWGGIAGIGAIAAAIAAAGVAMWLRADLDPAAAAPRPSPRPAERPVQPASPAPSPAAPTPAAIQPAAATRVALRIESTPPGADVYRALDGVRLGRTPLSHQIERGDGELALVLRLDGYRDRAVAIPIAADTGVSIELQPAPRQRRPRGAPPAASPRRPAVSPASGVGDEPIDPFDKLRSEGK